MQKIVNSSWRNALNKVLDSIEYHSLEAKIDAERALKETSIFPPDFEIFAALEACDLSEVKVVVLGQDPYHTKGFANGLAFSVHANVKPIPKSLANIFKELQADLQVPMPSNGDLKTWAEQGVLLLNTVFTVREKEANSHVKMGWQVLSNAIIEVLSKQENMVYLLFGRQAHVYASQLDSSKNLIIKTSHPSPLGVSKTGKDFCSFQGSRIFSKTNSYLVSKGKTPIRWECICGNVEQTQLSFD